MTQTVTMEPPERTDVWEKWAWLWAALFYATVVGSLALALLDDQRTAPAWVVGVLSAVLVLWHAVGLQLADRGRRAWADRAIARFVVFVADIVLWFVLVNLSPAFYLALFGLFAQAFRHLPIPYAAIAAGLLTAGTIVEQVSDSGELTLTSATIWLPVVAGLAAIASGAWIWAIIEQSTQRRELIDRLEAAQEELAAAQHREGVLAERQRLAREIHDTLAQGFVSIVLHLEAVEAADPDDLETIRTHLHQAGTTARAGLDQARRVVHDLRPIQLEEQVLHEAIRRTAKRWGQETGVEIATETTGDPVSQPIEIEATLLRVLQEALSNVRKHARATAVQLTLTYLDDVVILDVHDNGVGLADAQPSSLSGGFGLESVRQRAAEHGGAMTLESDPGDGTTLAVTIPLREPLPSPSPDGTHERDGQVADT